jgi:hypothetical protein
VFGFLPIGLFDLAASTGTVSILQAALLVPYIVIGVDRVPESGAGL